MEADLHAIVRLEPYPSQSLIVHPPNLDPIRTATLGRAFPGMSHITPIWYAAILTGYTPIRASCTRLFAGSSTFIPRMFFIVT